MNIKIGKYILTSDSRNFIIAEQHPRPTKKKKFINATISYHSSIEDALNGLLKRRLLESDAATLTELLNELHAHRSELSAILKGTV